MHAPPTCPTYAFFALLFGWATVTGCARWQEESRHESPNLPLVGENNKSVILDVEFIPLVVDEEDADGESSIWRWVDETAIEAGQRRHLTANGLRTGRVINVEKLRRRLEQSVPAQGAVDQFLATAEVASDVAHDDKRIPMRIGRRYELMLGQPAAGRQVTLLRVDDDTIGRTLDNPQFLLALRSTPGRASGRVNLRLRPEIQYGETKPQWVSSDAAWRIDSRRETWSLEQLDMNWELAEGETFVLTAALPPGGVAKQMLTGHAVDQSLERLVVLITADQIPGPRDRL